MTKKNIRLLLTALLASASLAITGITACGNLTGVQTASAAEYAGTSEDILAQIPSYTTASYTTVNRNVPYFSASELTTKAFENYSRLDSLGRCGVAYANVCKEIMPTEERGSIGTVKPSGWHLVKYAGIDGNYLYNRCHLIGYQLSGENANEKNLITGTRYLNVQGMLPFENQVAQYVKETGNHVLYRATPVFDGSDLVARGVLLEAMSVEDKGAGVQFNVFCYNVQPGITIDYADGSSTGPEFTGSAAAQTEAADEQTTAAGSTGTSSARGYIGNANTKKFHRSDCGSVKQMAEKNKVSLQSREEAIRQGYEPCTKCNP